MTRGWLRIPKEAAEYSAVKPRTFEDWLKSGLRFVKIRGCRMTKPQWIDDYLMGFEVNRNEVESIVNDVIREFE